MGLKDMFGKKKAQRPVGAKSAKRQRRGSAGGGVDQGYLFEGVFYLEDGTQSRDSDYAGSAYVSDNYSTSGTNGSYGGAGYGETPTYGSGYGGAATGSYGGSDSRDSGGASTGWGSSSGSDSNSSSGGGYSGGSDNSSSSSSGSGSSSSFD